MRVQDVLPRDAIPSIDDPAFDSEYRGEPGDEVIVVDGDPARAYPVRILSYHEIVNDVVDGRPVAVTWCPICWSGAVYERVVDGRTLTFGVSGKIADDALVMYDRETGSEWKQTTGEAIAGEFEGRRLAARPGPVVTWERFRGGHPDGVVLRPVRGDGGGARKQNGNGHGDGGPDVEGALEVYDLEPYERYAEGDGFGLHAMRGEGPPRSWDRDDVGAKTVVLGIERGGEAVAYPVPDVEAAGGVVTDTVGGDGVVVFAAGDGIAAFEDPGFDFEVQGGDVRADGATWDPVTGESADGRRLDPVPGRRLFAFAWQDAHGPDAFFTS